MRTSSIIFDQTQPSGCGHNKISVVDPRGCATYRESVAIVRCLLHFFYTYRSFFFFSASSSGEYTTSWTCGLACLQTGIRKFKGSRVGLERRSLSIVPVQENAIHLLLNCRNIRQRLRENIVEKEWLLMNEEIAYKKTGEPKLQN